MTIHPSVDFFLGLPDALDVAEAGNGGGGGVEAPLLPAMIC